MGDFEADRDTTDDHIQLWCGSWLLSRAQAHPDIPETGFSDVPDVPVESHLNRRQVFSSNQNIALGLEHALKDLKLTLSQTWRLASREYRSNIS